MFDPWNDAPSPENAQQETHILFESDPWKDAAASPGNALEMTTDQTAFDPWKDASSPGNEQVQLTTVQTKSSSLLVIFIHGFKGDDRSFKTFPQRIQDILSKSLPRTAVECIVFPTWETKGELTEAVAHFVKWLILLTVEKEKGIAGSAKIVLCGHSMGGLLAADSILKLARPFREEKKAWIWPRIVACVSFDTPYLGVNYKMEVAEKGLACAIVSAHNVFTGQWALSAPSIVVGTVSAPGIIAGAVLAGAVITSAWYLREGLGQGYKWATDHVKFVSHLWDKKVMMQRVKDLINLEKSHGILFRTFYVRLPPAPPKHPSSRTFILLPWPTAPHFVPVENSLVTNEIWAHMGMFAATTNDGYHELEFDVAKIIQRAYDIQINAQ